MTDKAQPPERSKLRQLWNRAMGRHPSQDHDRGWVTTKHGRRILPFHVEPTARGSIYTNYVSFMIQPRVRELEQQIQNGGGPGWIFLDRETGRFYRNSDVQKNGVGNARALGEIDMDLETDLFDEAKKNASFLAGPPRSFDC